jgi:drug/metabolite transporter (DMT)-like permease
MIELIFPCVCLVLMPFNGAIINIMLRNMRDMAELTLSTYIIFTMLVVYLPIFMVYETTDVYYRFTANDWFISVLLGFTSSSMQLVRTKALKYEEPARLSILNYFQPII